MVKRLLPLLAAAGALAGAPAQAADPAPGASGAATPPAVEMTCDRAGEPGRVRCNVEVRVKEGTIRWGDVVIRGAPGFALPLKGRIGPNEASLRDATTWRWALALVAKTSGRGEVVAEVRVLVCTDDKRCEGRSAKVRAEIVVGQ
ncbi:MAG: hypothetical protein JNL38_19875 [Myxococcales bacterium]|jgi:hypothetical protein|nr:hypothetical protein [Myxococcales bacterium]